MADESTIIEGTVKFRDGKKWKSRWCVMRKLSPVADCVHLQLWRDARARCAGAASKASLSLQHFLGSEASFTLDKHSHTLALVCRDLVAILAFETRERLIQWQVKVNAQLGEPRHYLVLVNAASGARRLPPGPARLHLHERRFALTAGVPPRLLGLWELPHLRRYGVVEGRFCFEGGSHCGKGEGLHVLITDQARDIARDFDLASQGRLSPRRRPAHLKANEGVESPTSQQGYRPDTRLSELNTIDSSLPPADLRVHERTCAGEDEGAVSPYWPSAERTSFPDNGFGDTASVNETVDGIDAAVRGGAGGVTLERCMSCFSKLGALSRSSTAALTPGAKHFSPAWTMEPVHAAPPAASEDAAPPCRCAGRPPARPPKPSSLRLNLSRRPARPELLGDKQSRIGPYENYDFPKLPSAEVEGEYYDTPKRLRECLDDELFKITKNSTPDAVILKKPCGCLLKFGKRRREPTIIDAEENVQPASCPCRRVTEWANNWIKLPYCRKITLSSDNLVPNKENVIPNDRSALYATVDLSRKTRRKLRPFDGRADSLDTGADRGAARRGAEVDDGPLADYENLSFALSLEHYENAKDLLRKAGVTQKELDAISANLKADSFSRMDGGRVCTKCGHQQSQRHKDTNIGALSVSKSDDYLMMEPNTREGDMSDRRGRLPAGYTPMSPIGAFAFNSLKTPARSPINRLLEEKSASNPTLCTPDESIRAEAEVVAIHQRAHHVPRDSAERRKRSSSADSSRFLEDVKEFEGSVGSRDSTSSIETLRNIAPDSHATCACATDNKHSDADSSETSKGGGCRSVPARRSALIPAQAGGNRDSSSSNDSGVSSWSLRRAAELAEFELPPTTAAARRHYRSARRAAGAPRAAPPRRSRSTGPLRDAAASLPAAKSSSAEAEVPVLSVKPLRGIMDTHSTSSGTSDMSDYIETLSLCSSHSSTDTPITMRATRQTTSTLRPRSGKEYQPLAPRLASVYRSHLYSNLP